jgi:hypothetical protein
MQDVKKKHYEITKIIKKPWKNMLIVKNIPMPFSFATFTKKNLNRLYDDVPCCFPVGQLDSLHNKIEKELLERPIVTICSSVVKNMYKGLNTNSAINISIFFTFMSTGFTLAMMVLGIFFS